MIPCISSNMNQYAKDFSLVKEQKEKFHGFFFFAIDKVKMAFSLGNTILNLMKII